MKKATKDDVRELTDAADKLRAVLPTIPVGKADLIYAVSDRLHELEREIAKAKRS